MGKKNKKRAPAVLPAVKSSTGELLARLNNTGLLSAAGLVLTIIFGVWGIWPRPATVVYQDSTRETLSGPMVFEILKPELDVHMMVRLEGGDQFQKNCLEWVISGQNPCQNFINDWNNNKISSDASGSEKYDPGIVSPKLILLNGVHRPIETFQMAYKIHREFYVASSKALGQNRTIKSLSMKGNGVVIGYEDYLKIEPSKMRRFSSLSEIPESIRGIHIRVLGKAQINVRDAIGKTIIKRVSN